MYPKRNETFVKLFAPIVALMAAAIFSWCLVPGHAQDRTEPRPNVVLIVADDLGYCDTGLYGCKDIPTPHIDSIGRRGVVFTDGYVTASTCSPSRAALMTGRYQQRFGFEFNAGPLRRAIEGEFGLPVSEITLAQVMKDSGYATGMVGKWHLGMMPRQHPLERGFDEYFGFLFGAHAYLFNENPPAARDRNTILRGRTPVVEKEYLTDAFTREAVDYIDKHAGEPFFLYVAYNAPHTPLQATQKYLERFADVQDEDRRTYMAMVSAMDDGVGRILARLREKNIDENTLVVFLSDNGCAVYTGACTNAPLRLGKTFLFEGGVRIPFALQFPARLGGGRTFRRPVSSLDLLPTIAAVAGVDLPDDRTLDGVDLMPYLTGGKEGDPARTPKWRNGPNRAIRQGDWKLFFNGRHDWLYNLSDDLGEMNNLYKDRPEVIERLKGLYFDWDSRMVDPLWPSRPTRRNREFLVDGFPIQRFI